MLDKMANFVDEKNDANLYTNRSVVDSKHLSNI